MKHGLHKHPLYNTWCNVKSRCHNAKNPRFKHYGGRDISMCVDWHDINIFISWCLDNGWKKGLQIDRIDNNGNYNPENCRFVTNHENNLNTRLLRSTNKTGFRGVNLHRRNKYAAGVKVNYKRINLGTFDTPEEAARVRDDYVIKNNLGLPLNFETPL